MKNYQDLINNENPRFTCEIFAKKNIVNMFGADTLENIKVAIGVCIEGKNRSKILIYENKTLIESIVG